MTTKIQQVLDMCRIPRSQSELRAAGLHTVRSGLYKLRDKGLLKQIRFGGKFGKETILWQTVPQSNVIGETA